MADTLRSTFPEKYCAWCGKHGECYLKHWGPLMRGNIVYLDDCAVALRSVNGNGVEPRFNCDTGEHIQNASATDKPDPEMDLARVQMEARNQHHE